MTRVFNMPKITKRVLHKSIHENTDVSKVTRAKPLPKKGFCQILVCVKFVCLHVRTVCDTIQKYY